MHGNSNIKYNSTLSLTSVLDGGGCSTPPLGHFNPGNDPVPIVQDDGWVPEPVWMGAENLAPTGIRSLDRPARSESPYRLSYRGPTKTTHVRFVFLTAVGMRNTVARVVTPCSLVPSPNLG